MRVVSCVAKNFASYKELSFDFRDKGLVLIHGATGSGKSTLCDVIPWCLFGRSAKNGTVDEVLSWPGDEVTEVIVYLDNVTVSRKRGPNSKDNDLMFWPVNGVVTRGKDLNDTQRLLNDFLGVDLDLYLASAYFHEFSQTAQFFTTNAKTRRTICEQIVDLTLPKTLMERIAGEKKPVVSFLEKYTKQQIEEEAALKAMQFSIDRIGINIADWEVNRVSELAALEIKRLNFNENLEKEINRLLKNKEKLEKDMKPVITGISDVCEHCGAPSKLARDNEKSVQHNEYLQLHIGIINSQLAKINTVNNYQESIDKLKATVNPHSSAIQDLSNVVAGKKDTLTTIEKKIGALNTRISDYELLTDSLIAMRSILIEQAIKNIEETTNTYLSNHFNAEIKVEFTVEDADKLTVNIMKDGNECSYTQLSKGQRQILKLCFGLSVMKQASNNSLTNFSQIFLDESLDGMDENFKMKAYGLLEELSMTYESIFLVEHSTELKAHFTNSIKVELVNGKSEIQCLS